MTVFSYSDFIRISFIWCFFIVTLIYNLTIVLIVKVTIAFCLTMLILKSKAIISQ